MKDYKAYNQNIEIWNCIIFLSGTFHENNNYNIVDLCSAANAQYAT